MRKDVIFLNKNTGTMKTIVPAPLKRGVLKKKGVFS
jgi:hypothetical protein